MVLRLTLRQNAVMGRHPKYYQVLYMTLKLIKFNKLEGFRFNIWHIRYKIKNSRSQKDMGREYFGLGWNELLSDSIVYATSETS